MSKHFKPGGNDDTGPKKPSWQPSEYYRKQRPDLFSDSTSEDSHSLGEDDLKYHLEKLTTEGREREFEKFARSLIEKEICPNLMSQTGPVGGGDSKTDSSTHPVAEELAERRYWGSQGRPAQDDWAFAFSAKKAWQEKMKDDLAKIAGLSRHFSKIFFVTSQPVPDKYREKWETRLGELHQRDIRIMDRTWLVEKVFKGQHVELAIAKLGLNVSISKTRKTGPRDAAREVELNELLIALRNPDLTQQDDYSLAEDYLEAGMLAAEIERPRFEVDGLFLQARNLAAKSSSVGLIIRAHYHHAWRSYFWFDDAQQTAAIYSAMEPYLEQIGTGEDCELFSNICNLLWAAQVSAAHVAGTLDKMTESAPITRLKKRLADLAADVTRPNTALYAKTLLVSWGMKQNLADKTLLAKTLDDYLDCFRRARGLATYPLTRFIDVIEGIGELFCTLPNYEAFQVEAQNLVAERCGERERGRMQLRHGLQLLTSKKHREALKELSKARLNLANEETLLDSGKAAFALGFVYRSLGCLWAARICLLIAARIVLYSIETMRSNPGRGFRIAIEMAWLELKLGRLAPFLAWRNFSNGLLAQVQLAGQDTTEAEEELEMQDGCLGCYFLKASLEEAAQLRELPPTLYAMMLLAARIGLHYSLGETSTIGNDLSLDAGQVEELIHSWRVSPAYGDLPAFNTRELGLMSTFETTLLGVRYRVRCKNALGPILYAESILGLLESVFADAKWENFAFIVETVELLITTGESGHNPPLINPDNFGAAEHALIWKPEMIEWMRNNSGKYFEHLNDFLSKLLLAITIDSSQDIKSELEAWKENGVFHRAYVAKDNFLALTDLIGTNEYDLKNWFNAAATPQV